MDASATLNDRYLSEAEGKEYFLMICFIRKKPRTKCAILANFAA